MGIVGLLPVLKSIANGAHVSKYSGQRVAIDAYSWLHKGSYSCSRELCEGIHTDKYVTYCMQRIALLRGCGVIPVVVFDGGRLPMKQAEEASRASSRQENLERARGLLASRNPSAAYECYQRAVDISPAAAKLFIEALKAENVEFIVAPYEADAQMAFLAINGKVDAVLTEDSDLLPYGCPRVFFKMDKTGEGQEICLADLGSNRGLSFVGFTHQMFLEMCIMAGCDFLKAVSGIGTKKAYQQMRKCRTFVRACKSLRFSGTSVPRGYEAAFQRAIWTFQHQRVFDPEAGKVVHLRPIPAECLVPAPGVIDALPEDDPELSFLGPHLDDVTAAAIARGDLDPITRRPFPQEPAAQQPRPHCVANNGTLPAYHGSGLQSSGANPQKGRKGPLQQGLAAFFPSVRAAAKGVLSSGSKSAPAKQPYPDRSQPVRHRLSLSQGVVAQPSSLPSRFMPAVAGTSCSSRASSGPAEGSQGVQPMPASLPSFADSQGSQQRRDGPIGGEPCSFLQGRAAELHTKGEAGWSQSSLEGVHQQQGGEATLSDSMGATPSLMDDFEGSEHQAGASTGKQSLKAQLAASARFLSQEEAALSQGSLPGAGISAPLQQAAGWASPSVSQGLPSCTAAPSNTLGLEESPTVEREVFGGRAGPRPTALSGCQEAGDMSDGALDVGTKLASGNAAGGLPGPRCGLAALSPGTLNQHFYAAISPEEARATPSDTRHRDPLSSGEGQRLPLSSVRQPVISAANGEHREPPSTMEKKRKISHFFGRQLKKRKARSPDENSLANQLQPSVMADRPLPGADLRAALHRADDSTGKPGEGLQTRDPCPGNTAALLAGNHCQSIDCTPDAVSPPEQTKGLWSRLPRQAANRGEDDDSAVESSDEDAAREGASKTDKFHSLGHLPMFAATARATVNRLAARRGAKAAAEDDLSARTGVHAALRAPGPDPDPASPTTAVKAGSSKRDGGRFSNFAFSRK